MTSAPPPRYRARVVLRDGTVLLKELSSRDALSCLKDFYHLLLDEEGPAFAHFPAYKQWFGQAAAAHGLKEDAGPAGLLETLAAAGALVPA